MRNSAPYEIVAGPGNAWIAVADSTFPAVDATPSSPWTLLGTSGNLNIADDGIVISMQKTVAKYRATGDTGVRKTFMTERDVMISLTLNDLSLEQLKYALNGNAITAVAASSGVAGTKRIGLSIGTSLTTYALIVRVPSPYGDNMVAQFQWKRVQENGATELGFVKGQPAGLKLEFSVLVDPNAASEEEYDGSFLAQTAAAT